MAPTAAPWAKPGGVPLPPVSRGELTKAPWAPASGPALAGRPVDAAVPDAQPRLPPVAADDWGPHTFLPAAKRIHTAAHLKQFLRSEAARDFMSFVLALSEAVRGKQLSDPCQVGRGRGQAGAWDRSESKGAQVGLSLPSSRLSAPLLPVMLHPGISGSKGANGGAGRAVGLGG
jgi:hypothetical protein